MASLLHSSLYTVSSDSQKSLLTNLHNVVALLSPSLPLLLLG